MRWARIRKQLCLAMQTIGMHERGKPPAFQLEISFRPGRQCDLNSKSKKSLTAIPDQNIRRCLSAGEAAQNDSVQAQNEIIRYVRQDDDAVTFARETKRGRDCRPQSQARRCVEFRSGGAKDDIRERQRKGGRTETV